MANFTERKTVLLKGGQGERGEAAENDTTIPEGGIILFDGETAPTGYEITDAPTPQEPNYNWYYNEAKTLVVREKISDGSFRWYFNGIYIPTSPFVSIPSNLASFIKNNVLVGCKNHELDSYRDNCQVGFYDNTLRAWTQGLGGNVSGYVWAIMESTDTGLNMYVDQCYHPWEEPTFDPYTG